LRTNRALKAAELDVKSMRASYRAAQWNAFPKADLIGAFGGNGLGGTGRDVIFGSDTLRNNMDTKFSDAFEQALNRDYPTWMIGIQLSIPILLREKGGERDRMRAELSRVEARYAQARHDIEEQVLANHRELENGINRLTAAQDGVRAARDQVRIGVIEFRNGTTTAFELARLGSDFANSQRRYSQALVRSAKAAARLNQLAPPDED
jgi:outer membrane protein TolC